VFKVTTNGVLTTLASFGGGSGGAVPAAGLTLGEDGNFYGTTMQTVFQVRTNGKLTTLASIPNYNPMSAPEAGLILGNDGNFYGTTVLGGNTSLNGGFGVGTVFKVTTNGVLTTLVSFSDTNGVYPNALTLGNDGNFYGTTYLGGASNDGTVFRMLLPPTITVQPESQTDGDGATVTFLVSATSLTPMGYQWQKNGTNLVDGGSVSGATTNKLIITGISDSDAGTYSVILTNSDGNVTSSSAVLVVHDVPFIVTQPLSQTVDLGSSVTFTIKVYGVPPFVFQWYFNGTPFGLPATGINFSSCTLTNVGTNQAGNYSVLVVNDYGSVTSSNAALTVVSLPPIIATQPLSRTNNAGTAATFSVVAFGSLPLNYQWQKNGTNLANGGKISGVTTTTLTITSVLDNDAGIYSVTVTNLASSATSSNATLTVIDPPSVTAQPLGQRVLLGGSVSFSVSVSGTPPFSYQWRLNGISLLKATNAAYAIQAVGATNTGSYSAVVTNLAGSVTSSNALLTVIVPPTLALRLSAGYPLLNLNGMLSSNFVVQYRTNLAGTNWVNLLSLTNLPSGPYQFLDSGGVGQAARYYRAYMQ
jgi:hypothetical protein